MHFKVRDFPKPPVAARVRFGHQQMQSRAPFVATCMAYVQNNPASSTSRSNHQQATSQAACGCKNPPATDAAANRRSRLASAMHAMRTSAARFGGPRPRLAAARHKRKHLANCSDQLWPPTYMHIFCL